MEIINLCENNSLVSQFMSEIRDKNIQQDRLRFRANVHRLGQIMAYEISKKLEYKTIDTETPLALAKTSVIADQLLLATILRAGLPLHESFLNYFDKAENAFVSAYRKYDAHDPNKFDVKIEYLACPSINDKVLCLVDPMLATGLSMALAYKALLSRGTPKHVHIASIIATDQAVEFVKNNLANENLTIWACDIDHELNAHSYIVPGLGDAGDLLYGEKL